MLTGPWNGWSIQFGIRISESIVLKIDSGRISGCGHDKDGDFDVAGTFSQKTQLVMLTRRYTWTSEPTQSGIGVPYDYLGHWDGTLVSGRWHPRWDLADGGPFELWPANEEETFSLALLFEDAVQV